MSDSTVSISQESSKNSIALIDELLTRGVSKIIDEKSLRSRLEAYEAADPADRVPLRIKFGIDPTGTIVHLGHMVPILKLRAFQDLGHTIVLIIGDATAQVGDTSDKDGERPMLTREKTRENASNWLSLFGKVLILPEDSKYGKPAPAKISENDSVNPLAGRIPGKFELRYNSEWMDTTNFNAVGELAANFSVAEMLDRDNFSKRYNGGVRISLQEFLYPIMQGWDSVAVQADVELGGNDQYFNLLAGRRLQEAHGQRKQDIMTFDLLLGGDGKKMSKTGGNTIAVDMSPNEMFVKVMEVKDEFVWDFFELTTRKTLESLEIHKINVKEDRSSIILLKISLAKELVTQYHGTIEALNAWAYYVRVIQNKELPAEHEFNRVGSSTKSPTLTTLLKELKCFSTTGDVRNAIDGRSIVVAWEIATSPNQIVELSEVEPTLITVWKKKFFAVFYAPDAV